MALLLAPAGVFPGGALLESGAAWGPDKLGHALLFAGLALLASRSLGLVRLAAPRLAGGLFATAWGGLAEALQALVASRSPELGDLAANALGAAVALAAAILVERQRAAGPRRRPARSSLEPQLRLARVTAAQAAAAGRSRRETKK